MGFPWLLLLFLFSFEIFIEPGTKGVGGRRQPGGWEDACCRKALLAGTQHASAF